MSAKEPRTFTAPTSLNGTLAMAQQNGQGAEGGRSDEQAANSAASHSKELMEPLASHKPAPVKPGVTFGAQDKLPKLPIPELEDTCRRFLEALEPLQSNREHRDTELAVQEFLREGQDLQERLKKYASGKSSYIEQFWYDSYLNFDNPVVLNLNPFFLLEDDPTPARNNQVTRAASLVVSALAFVRAVRKEELPPDMLRKQPLDMYQYSRMFGTARIPTDNGCQIAQDPTSKHVVVLCRGQFYWFDALDANHDVIMTEGDVAKNLEAICNDAEETPIQDAAKAAIGVLSTENRKIWSGLRDVISREEGSNNADCLSIVDSSLFIVCLDYTEPATSAQLSANMLCGTSQIERGVQIGTCTNRWYDKLQIIVCKNGSAGINFEHTGVDGHTVLRFASDVYTDTILRFAKSINGQAPSLWASNSPDPSKRDPASFGAVSTTPHKLEWDMIPELSTALRFAETRLADLIQQNEFETLEFSTYGKNFITSMGFSPDAFVQMAFQAAYYGLYGRIECVYEPAMTKVYYHGRTEAIRAVTPESVDFVRTFWAENPASKKVEALRAACSKHTAITKQCSQAQGQDRHLYALYCVWQRSVDANGAEATSLDNSTGASTNGCSSPSPSFASDGATRGTSADGEAATSSPPPARSSTTSARDSPAPSQSRARADSATHNGNGASLPAIFADAGYEKLNNTILSTSNCGNPSLRHFGFGPSSGDGFGIGYIIKDGSISICASSKHRQTRRYVDAMESYFLEIRKLLRQTQRRGTSNDKTASRAREVDEAADSYSKAGRTKSRGKALTSVRSGAGAGATQPDRGATHGVEDDDDDDDDDGLGGYGFFDAGMLLKLDKEERERDGGGGVGEKGIGMGMGRNQVGRRLRLAEY